MSYAQIYTRDPRPPMRHLMRDLSSRLNCSMMQWIRTWRTTVISITVKIWRPPCRNQDGAGSGISVVYLWSYVTCVNRTYACMPTLALPCVKVHIVAMKTLTSLHIILSFRILCFTSDQSWGSLYSSLIYLRVCFDKPLVKFALTLQPTWKRNNCTQQEMIWIALYINGRVPFL